MFVVDAAHYLRIPDQAFAEGQADLVSSLKGKRARVNKSLRSSPVEDPSDLATNRLANGARR